MNKKDGKLFPSFSIYTPLTKRNLLLVDDNLDLVIIVKKSLEREGYSVFVAGSGEEAIEMVQNNQVDLILMDIEMNNGMDGIEAARIILKKYEIPLIFLSSHTETSYIQRAGSISSYGYVVKECGTGVMLASIKMAFKLHDAHVRLKHQEEEIREKERIHDLSFKILGLGTFTADIKQGTWTSSPVLDDIYGIDKDYVKTFDSWLELVSDDCRLQVGNEFYNCLRDKRKFDMVYKVVRLNDKKDCWVHSVGDFDKANDDLMVGTILNITQRKNFEIALSESETNYRTLLNASPEGIVVMDLKGRIEDVSIIALELFEKKENRDLIGKLFFDLIEQEEKLNFQQLLKSTLAEGLVQNKEMRFIRSNSVSFPGEISTTLIQEKSGKPKAFMAIIRDTSERKKMEQQMIHNERMISLGEMAAGIAHEINQPLNNISISLDNMMMKLESGEMNPKYLSNKSRNIFEGIGRIESIINYIRAYSRKYDDIIAIPFDINSCVRFATMLISEQLGSRGIEVLLELDDNSLIINGNNFKFEQVILNLLTNSRDAIEEKANEVNGNSEKIIKISTCQEDSNYLVNVSDTGIGIKENQLEKIMIPFYTTKPLGKGTGLGLSLASKIIDEMKGKITVNSRYREGTSITISVPRNKI